MPNASPLQQIALCTEPLPKLYTRLPVPCLATSQQQQQQSSNVPLSMADIRRMKEQGEGQPADSFTQAAPRPPRTRRKASSNSSSEPSRTPPAPSGIDVQGYALDNAAATGSEPSPRKRTYMRKQVDNRMEQPGHQDKGDQQQQGETSMMDDEEQAEAKRSYHSAMGKALGLLGKRAYTTAEMAEKLRKREIHEDVIERVQARLTALGALDDAVYAQLFVSSKWRQTKRGPSLIRQDMLRRGLEASLIDAALQAFFGDEQQSLRVSQPVQRPSLLCNEQNRRGVARSGSNRKGASRAGEEEGDHADGLGDEDADSPSGYSHNSGSHDDTFLGEGAALGHQLLEVVCKRQACMQHLPEDTQRRRLLGFLQRRGHSWGTARQVLQSVGLMK